MRVEIVHNTQHTRYAYRYTIGKDRLFLQAGPRSYVGSTNIGGIEGLLAGGYATHGLDLEDANSELQLLRPR